MGRALCRLEMFGDYVGNNPYTFLVSNIKHLKDKLKSWLVFGSTDHLYSELKQSMNSYYVFSILSFVLCFIPNKIVLSNLLFNCYLAVYPPCFLAIIYSLYNVKYFNRSRLYPNGKFAMKPFLFLLANCIVLYSVAQPLLSPLLWAVSVLSSPLNSFMPSLFVFALDNFYRFTLSPKIASALGVFSSAYLLKFEIATDDGVSSDHFNGSLSGFHFYGSSQFDSCFDYYVSDFVKLLNDEGRGVNGGVVPSS